MAFRGRRFRSRGRGFRSRFSRGANQKWVAHHSIQFMNAANQDPLTPGTFETGMVFVPLVSTTDYGDNLSDNIISAENRQERSKIIRSVGHFAMINLNEASGETDLMATELYWYFACLSRDEVTNANLLDAASGFGTGTDAYNPGLQEGPALWRQPVKRFGMTTRIQGFTQINAALGTYQETQERSWDFNPNARLQTPEQWYLCIGVNLFALTASFPADIPFMLLVMGRTLIQD